MSLISPRLFQPTLVPEHKRLLELREELLDLQNREAVLELELENMPTDIISSSSEADSDSEPNLETWTSFVFAWYFFFTFGWVGGPLLITLVVGNPNQ